MLVDGASVGDDVTTYTFQNISEPHTIRAVFAVDMFTISSGSEGNGTISPQGAVEVPYGSSQVFTISPDQGYTVDAVRVDGVSIGGAATYTFTDVTGDHEINAQFVMEPRAPIADAGPDQRVDERITVQLNASNSIDFDDGIERFHWEQVGGVPVEMSIANEPEAAFTAPDVGEEGESLVFRVTVTDYSGKTGTDDCIVNVSWVNVPPMADAGENQTVAEKRMVVLDGSASEDPDDGITSYAWTQIEGVPVALSNPNIENPAFLAPDVLPEGASLKLRLEVSDNGGLLSQDVCTVNVTWENDPPQADAGPDLAVAGDAAVVLDGSGSLDRDDGISMHMWKQLTGPPVVLTDTTAEAPEFTTPACEKAESLSFMLTVSDSGGLQDSDTCEITVNGSAPPPTESYEFIRDNGQIITVDTYSGLANWQARILHDGAGPSHLEDFNGVADRDTFVGNHSGVSPALFDTGRIYLQELGGSFESVGANYIDTIGYPNRPTSSDGANANTRIVDGTDYLRAAIRDANTATASDPTKTNIRVRIVFDHPVHYFALDFGTSNTGPIELALGTSGLEDVDGYLNIGGVGVPEASLLAEVPVGAVATGDFLGLYSDTPFSSVYFQVKDYDPHGGSKRGAGFGIDNVRWVSNPVPGGP